MPRKKKQEVDNGGPVVVIMIITLALLFFFVIFWQKNLIKIFKPQENHWRTVDQVQITPRD